MDPDPPVASPPNPFSTRYVRPSVARYLFPDGGDAEQLLRSLADTHWWGQIVGPHGSGKSTLLHTLVPRIEQSGRKVAFYSLGNGAKIRTALRSGIRQSSSCIGNSGEFHYGLIFERLLNQAQRRLGVSRCEVSTWNNDTQVVVDGFEQLNWLSRIWLRRVCHNHRAGLLVTAHESVGLPTLWTTPTSVHLAYRIVTDLLGPSQEVGITEADIHKLFQENRGDIRELLMALYDLYAQQTAGVG